MSESTIERLRAVREVATEALYEHPLAKMVPEMRAEEWDDFLRDVTFAGIKVPLEVLGDGTVIDGRHRLRAAKAIGMKTVPTIAPHLSGDSPDIYMLKAAVLRRHLTDDQRAVVARDWADLNEKQPGLKDNSGDTLPPISHPTQAAAAAMFKVSGEKVKDAGYVKKHAPDEFEKIRRGEISLTKARKAARQKVAISRTATPSLAEQAREVSRSAVRILNRDASLPDSWRDVTADLVIFSPPYNVGMDYRGGNSEDHSEASMDALPHEQWCQLLTDVGRNILEVTAAIRVCVNFPMGIGRNPYKPLLPDVLTSFTEYETEGIIIWDKMTTGNRTSWGSWRKPSEPRLRDRTELIVILRRKGSLATIPAAVLDAEGFSPWLSADDFTELTQDLWKISPADRSSGHPAPFPVELPERLIRLYGWPGCTVVDPFAGSGTTGLAAVKVGANVILMDRNESYCDMMRQRLS